MFFMIRRLTRNSTCKLWREGGREGEREGGRKGGGREGEGGRREGVEGGLQVLGVGKLCFKRK